MKIAADTDICLFRNTCTCEPNYVSKYSELQHLVTQFAVNCSFSNTAARINSYNWSFLIKFFSSKIVT